MINGKQVERSVRIPLPPELQWFLSSSVALWLLSLAYIAAKFLFYPHHHRGLPVELIHQPPFPDISAMIIRLPLVHQEAFFSQGFVWIYPAPCIFLYRLFVLFSSPGPNQWKPAAALYFVIVLSGLFLLMWNMTAALTRRGLAKRHSWLLMIGTALLSWPIYFAMHQANIEAILWIGVAVAVWAYYRGMWWTSALLIGVVASFKIYPILLLALFLAPRKFRQIAVSVLTFVAMTILALAYIGPTIPIAYQRVSDGVRGFTWGSFYPGPVDRDYLALDHSLGSLFRILTTAHPEYMSAMYHYYLPVAAILMTAYFFAFIWKTPRINQVFVIIIAMTLLPPKSYDYTLELLYIPWAWLAMLGVSAAARGTRIPGLMPVMICLAVICSPEIFIKYRGYDSYGQFKTLFLLALLWLAAKYRFADDQPLGREI